MRNSTAEKIVFTIVSLLIIFLFHFSLELKHIGVAAFGELPLLDDSFVSNNKEMLSAFAKGFGLLFYDSLLTIIVLFFYQRYYRTLFRSAYNKVVYFITLIVVLICIALFIIYWLHHLLDVSIITGYWAY
jgi:hypothetical protein